jgi:hypothetical protein
LKKVNFEWNLQSYWFEYATLFIYWRSPWKFFCTSRLTRLTSVCEHISASNFWCADCIQLEIFKAKLFNRYFLFKLISSIELIQYSAKMYRPSRLTRHLHVAAEIWNFKFSHFILIYRLL